MDAALDFLDPLVLDKAYSHIIPDDVEWPRDRMLRQIVSIMAITQVGATALYFVFSALSYYCVFDRRLEYHPRFLKDQIKLEIISSMSAVPFINVLTMPFFLAEVRGKSLLYTHVDEHAWGWSWMLISTVLFMIWNDFFIYWIHRLEHHPSVYKYIHKPHHKWIGECTPHAVTNGREINPRSPNSLGGASLPPARRICAVPTLPVSHLPGDHLHTPQAPNIGAAFLSSSVRCRSTST